MPPTPLNPVEKILPCLFPESYRQSPLLLWSKPLFGGSEGGNDWEGGARGGGDYVSKHLFTPKHLSLPSRIININATLLSPFFFPLQTTKPHENLKIVRGPCRPFFRKSGGPACLGGGPWKRKRVLALGSWRLEVDSWESFPHKREGE